MSKSPIGGVQQIWLLPGESIAPLVLLPVDLGGGHLAIEAMASYKNLKSRGRAPIRPGVAAIRMSIDTRCSGST
jgi:hypothetical protein